MATQAKTQHKTNEMPWLVGTAVLVVIGAVAWIIQLIQGMSVTGIGQAIVWGVYIATFFTLAGLAGGLSILAALSEMKVIPGLKASQRNLLIGALASFIAAGFMILMDIGKPYRVLNMIFYANVKSPFVWDFICLALGVVVIAIYLFFAPKSKALVFLSGILGALVIIVEGWILSMSAGSPLWHGGMMSVIFLIEGMMTASAVTLITPIDAKAQDWLRSLLLALLPALVVVHIIEMASVMYAGEPDAKLAMSLISANPLFWAELVLGIVVPFFLLGWVAKNRSAAITAAVLVVLGVLVAKSLMLVAGQAIPFLQKTATYTPTLVEYGGVIGVIGLFGLLYMLGRRLVPQK